MFLCAQFLSPNHKSPETCQTEPRKGDPEKIIVSSGLHLRIHWLFLANGSIDLYGSPDAISRYMISRFRFLFHSFLLTTSRLKEGYQPRQLLCSSAWECKLEQQENNTGQAKLDRIARIPYSFRLLGRASLCLELNTASPEAQTFQSRSTPALRMAAHS